MNTRFTFSYLSCCHLFLLIVFGLFHFCLSNQNNQKSNDVLCMDTERQALLMFKHGLTDETNRLASWVAEDRECCKWAGITCDNSTGHVIRVHLRGLDGHCHFQNSFNTKKEYEEDLKQRLIGDISPSLLDLKQLMHLDLSCNHFGGIEVRKFIGSLENLKYLNLSNSNFGGIIPSQLGNLSELNVLCLGSFGEEFESTSVKDMQWLSSLRMLRHLDMSGVDLSEATDWLQVINTLPYLVQLHMSSCQLSNILPYVSSLNLTSLSLLDISDNYFGTLVPQWIFSVTSLVSLDLSRCHFRGIIPSSNAGFRNLTSLELLYIPGNGFIYSSTVLNELSSSNLILLDISNCGVSSSLLNSLRNLTSLLSLDVSRNVLTKKIPKSLVNLCDLIELDLSFNNFSSISLAYLLGSLFDCKSPALKLLSVINSGLSGPIPYSIGRLSSLEELYLDSNQLNGSLPNSIGQLSSLKMLHLSKNRLDGSLPNSLGQLSELISLSFSYNLLTGFVTEAHFAKLASLKTLHGTDNNLTLRLEVAEWIPPFRLESLSLKSWVLGPQFPSWLQSQKDLMELDISNANISSLMPESFLGSFPNLIYLNISHNHIQGTLLGIPTSLLVVNLGSNEFGGSLHHLLCSNGLKDTLDLNLGNNHLSGVIPECWENWHRLIFLNLENNNLSGEIPKTLGLILNLRLLNMRENKISGRLPSSLMNLTRLGILQLGRNELIGNIPTWIGTKLAFLGILNLRSNHFDGIIPHELCYLMRVQILDLAHNNLSGNIPRCFNNFSVLSGKETKSEVEFSFSYNYGSSIAGDSLVLKGKEDLYSTILRLVMLLDLSSNNLVGHIPSELTSLVELKSLNLSRNQLTGTIPEKVGDMKALESFDLSVNKLSGKLPMSLSRLNFLSNFNVSYNNLTGRIPTSTQIQSLNESSFFGNKLCGPPLPEDSDGCVSNEAPVDKTQDQKKDDEADWGFIISIVLGFVTGFWIVMAPLVASRSWRIAYFRLLSKLRYTIYDVMY